MKAPAAAGQLNRAAALAACPARLQGPLVVPDGAGGARIEVSMEPARWAVRLFGARRGQIKTFELDEVGLHVWKACDGQTSVQQLIAGVAARYNLNLREAEVSTLQFLRTLTRKGLIAMTFNEAGHA